MLTLATLVLLAGLPVAVEVGADAPCALGTALPPALAAQGLDVGPHAGWRVEAKTEGDRVTVRLLDATDAIAGVRVFTLAGDDCSVFPKTVALLVKWWLSQKLPQEDAPPKPVEAPRPVKPVLRPAPPPVARAAAKVERPALAVPSPAAPPPPGVPPPVPAPEPKAPEEAPAAPVWPGLSLSPREEAAPAPAPSRQTGAIAAFGALAFAPADQSVAAAGLAAEWGFREPFALTLEGGAQGTRSATLAPGGVNVSMQWAGVGLRVALSAATSTQIALGLGGHVGFLEAASHDYLHTQNVVLVTGGGQAFAEWRQALIAGAFLVVRVEGQMRIRPESFSVDGVGEVLRLPMWGFLMGLGLGWAFR